MASLKQEIEALKICFNASKETVEDLKLKAAVTDERVKTIFTRLDEIKSGIEKVNMNIESMRSQPSKAFWSILVVVAAALILAGLKLS